MLSLSPFLGIFPAVEHLDADVHQSNSDAYDLRTALNGKKYID